MHEEPTQAMALLDLIDEATMEPFDIGPAFVTGPLPSKPGEMLAVEKRKLEAVFSQLRERLIARLPVQREALRRMWRKADAYDQLRALLGAAL